MTKKKEQEKPKVFKLKDVVEKYGKHRVCGPKFTKEGSIEVLTEQIGIALFRKTRDDSQEYTKHLTVKQIWDIADEIELALTNKYLIIHKKGPVEY